MAGRRPIIEIRNLDKFFGEFQALNDVSLTVHAGERMVICGPSGSGKSTLIRCINRLEEPSAGRLVVDGVALTGARENLRRVRTEVGMVFQQFNLFPHLTVLENLTLVHGSEDASEARNAPKYLVRVTSDRAVRPTVGEHSGCHRAIALHGAAHHALRRTDIGA